MLGTWIAAAFVLQGPFTVSGADVQLRVERLRDGTLIELYAARDATGKMRTILVSPIYSALRVDVPAKSSPLLQIAAGGLYESPPSFGFTTANQVDNANGTVVSLTSKTDGYTIVKRIHVPKHGTLMRVEVQCDFAKDNNPIRYLLDAYAFAPDGKAMRSYGKPDATFAPAIRPAENGVIGDHYFRSPVVTVQKGSLAASVMPDLDVLQENRYIPTILDLNAKTGVVDAPMISYGFADYRLTGHVYFAHDPSMTRLAPPQLIFAQEILLDAKAEPFGAYQKAAKHQWDRYGHRYIDKVLPQAMPFEEYAKVCYPAAFNEKETGGWFEHEINGVVCGGMPSGWGRHEGWVSWQPWFNQLRSAWGLRWWGKKLGNADWVDKADKMLNLALAAPMKDGAVPTTYQSKTKDWKGCLITPDAKCYYDLTNMAWKGIWMLRWLEFEDCPRREEILRQCHAMAMMMVAQQNKDGSFPTWLDKDLKVVPVLDRSAQSALPLWFLSEFATLRGTQGPQSGPNLELAIKAGAKFLAEEVVDGQYWYDFETFFSCSPKQCFQRDGQFNHDKMRDPHTLQAPQNTLCMHWTAEALMAASKLSKNEDLAKQALKALDTLTLTQNVWPISYRKAAYTYGGFGVQNSDGEYNDARQAQFGDTLADFGAALGRPDYFERGVAAVRASMALINHPLHIKLGIYPNPNYPLGLQPENTGHGGTDQQNGRTGPDWGEMSGLTSMAYLLHRYGPSYTVAGRKVTVDGGYAPEPKSPEILRNPTFNMKDWRMPGWSFMGDFLHWPVNNPRRFNWNNGGLPFIGTCEDGRGAFDDEFTGTIESPWFTVSGGEIRLNVGGGSGEGVYVELVDESNQRIAVARGTNNETMQEVRWDVAQHAGKKLRLRVVDSEKGGWGHINVGNIRCTGN
jgi:hypothetical protein